MKIFGKALLCAATLLLTTTPAPAVPTGMVSSIDQLLADPLLTSTRKKPIRVLTVPLSDRTSEAPVYILLQGGLHGDEALTTTFVSWLAKRVANRSSLLNALPAQTVIDFIPKANPDSYRKSRYNANQVNLNRNFGFLWGRSVEPMGASAFSERETIALRALMERRRYLAAIDIHGYVNWVVAPTEEEGTFIDMPLSKRLRLWHGAIAKHLPLLRNYEFKTPMTLGDGGAFEDWAFWNNNTLALCLELRDRKRFTEGAAGKKDSFPQYERFIFAMLQEAFSIRDGVTFATLTPEKSESAPSH